MIVKLIDAFHDGSTSYPDGTIVHELIATKYDMLAAYSNYTIYKYRICITSLEDFISAQSLPGKLIAGIINIPDLKPEHFTKQNVKYINFGYKYNHLLNLYGTCLELKHDTTEEQYAELINHSKTNHEHNNDNDENNGDISHHYKWKEIILHIRLVETKLVRILLYSQPWKKCMVRDSYNELFDEMPDIKEIYYTGNVNIDVFLKNPNIIKLTIKNNVTYSADILQNNYTLLESNYLELQDICKRNRDLYEQTRFAHVKVACGYFFDKFDYNIMTIIIHEGQVKVLLSSGLYIIENIESMISASTNNILYYYDGVNIISFDGQEHKIILTPKPGIVSMYISPLYHIFLIYEDKIIMHHDNILTVYDIALKKYLSISYKIGYLIVVYDNKTLLIDLTNNEINVFDNIYCAHILSDCLTYVTFENGILKDGRYDLCTNDTVETPVKNITITEILDYKIISADIQNYISYDNKILDTFIHPDLTDISFIDYNYKNILIRIDDMNYIFTYDKFISTSKDVQLLKLRGKNTKSARKV